MEQFVLPLLFLISVILVVSLVYIIMTTRHKEKMTLIEKGLDPKKFSNNQIIPQTQRAGLLLVGIGFGFFVALFLSEYVLTSIENSRAVYAGSILLFGGLGLLTFYSFNKNKFKN